MAKDERTLVGSLHPEAWVDHDYRPWTRPATLDVLGRKHGTDKSSQDHGYLDWYDDYLWQHRYDRLTLLEIGVWKGASLRMWREYFPNATIVGIDNVRRDVVIPGVDIHRCSQENETGLHNLRGLYDDFNVIVDDASHISSKTIIAFKALWPALAPGGIYVIEDLQTSYDAVNYPKEAYPDPDGVHRGGRTPGGRLTAMAFCKRLADEANSSLFPEEYRLGYDVASVQFFPNICFITKAGKWSAK